jgi:hypothetical protein
MNCSQPPTILHHGTSLVAAETGGLRALIPSSRFSHVHQPQIHPWVTVVVHTRSQMYRLLVVASISLGLFHRMRSGWPRDLPV